MGFRNMEHYTDNTAGIAIARADREAYFARMEEKQKVLAVKLTEAEKGLNLKGCHLEGRFRVVDNATGIYLKVERQH